MIKLALIGAGRHASRNIYPSLVRLEGAEIVANCDLNIGRAQELASHYGIPQSYSDYREMVRRLRPDGVIVCINADAHAKIASELMKDGVHVYVEKPTAPSLDIALGMLEISLDTARICMTGYKKRFAPVYVRTRRLIDSVEFGEPTSLSIFRSDGDPSEPVERLSRDLLLRWTCHTLDLGVFLWGSVESVRTDVVTVGGKFALSVTMHHRHGRLSHQLLTYYPSARGERLHAIGSNGLMIETDNSLYLSASRYGQPFDSYTPDFSTGNSFSDVEQGFSGQLQEFASAVAESRQPSENSLLDSCHSLAVFEAMWRSCESGSVEPVPVLGGGKPFQTRNT